MSITSIAGFIGQEAESILYGERCYGWTKFDGRYLLDLNHDGYTDIYDGYLHGGCSNYKSGKMLFREHFGELVTFDRELDLNGYIYDNKTTWETTNPVPEIRWHKSENDFGAKLGDVIQFGGTNVWLESVTWDDPQDPSSQQFILRKNVCGSASEPISVYIDSMPSINGRTVDLKQEVMDRFNCEHGLAPCRETSQELPIIDVEYLNYEIEKFHTRHRNDLNALSNLAKQMEDCKNIDKGELLSTWSKIAPDLKDLILRSFVRDDQNDQACTDAIWIWLEQAYGIDQNFYQYIKESIREINI